MKGPTKSPKNDEGGHDGGITRITAAISVEKRKSLVYFQEGNGEIKAIDQNSD